MYVQICIIQHCSTGAIAVNTAQLARFDNDSIDPKPILSCLCTHALHVPLTAASKACTPYLQLPPISPALALLHLPQQAPKAVLVAQHLSVLSTVVLLLA